jgi:hypothetical protein
MDSPWRTCYTHLRTYISISQCKKREIEINAKKRETYKQTGMKKGEVRCPSIPQNILDIRLSFV